MTRSSHLLDALLPLVADLAHELPAELRYQRLLAAMCRLLPCDAAALLRLDGGVLVPLSVQGLSADTLGRRFEVEAHPRLKALLGAPSAMRFPTDCDLPDPYDGLVEGAGDKLEVHDCMGCALQVGEGVWGVLTLDALHAERFSDDDLRLLDAFADLAAATVVAAARLDQLTMSVESERSRAEAYRLAAQPQRAVLAGQSPAYRQMASEIALVAPSELTVLITGETGVGKELVARQLHASSPRADKVLVSVNCAALPETLVESELFGHVRGAFSGAVGDRRGKFEMADGGTLFLDEIGELPLAVQAKLLRALQDGQLQRVGSDREHRVDVRLIAATNRDLAAEVRAGRFRADLYHRLSVFPLNVPPLRERGRDVLVLAGAFIEENRRRMGLRGLRLSAGAQAALLAHAWPGNVRELEYLIARAALKAKARQASAPAHAPRHARAAIVTVEATDLDLEAHAAALPGVTAAPVQDAPRLPPTGTPRDLRTEVDAFQKRLVEQALEQHQGNTAAAARMLGLDRANLVRLAERLGVALRSRPPQARGGGRNAGTA
ncbi:nitric oxide reductase transcriptional regulator NorR [Variovorax sp. OV329]|uniref:nitric oxide reductase transcriptional regulator NorR n=1 Tax=Variovorax sp. OV329 TaxID=1882825 RepID=UPI0008ED2516|nr:nitric oxide reductase transcriptional regulator NorR [Variovorax sp. OV329]SFL89232.1 anaerobic nitric oxide reductase transcription regulator [Variovorax sp. OV329]